MRRPRRQAPPAHEDTDPALQAIGMQACLLAAAQCLDSSQAECPGFACAHKDGGNFVCKSSCGAQMQTMCWVFAQVAACVRSLQALTAEQLQQVWGYYMHVLSSELLQ